METRELDAPEQMEGFNARLRGIESIIEKAMQRQNNNLTLNFFLSSVGQHVERTDSAHVWMRGNEVKETQTIGDTSGCCKLTPQLVMSALQACKDEGLIWANSAYSVVFCVCRDEYAMENNATYFERLLAEGGIVIPEGTINNCISRHPWMRYPIDKWKENGAKGRALKLRDAFRQQMELLLIPAKKTA